MIDIPSFSDTAAPCSAAFSCEGNPFPDRQPFVRLMLAHDAITHACCLRHQSHSSADARRRSSRQRCLTSCPCPLDWAAQRACHRYRLVPDLRPKRASLRCAPIRNPILQRAVVAAAYRLDRPNSISAAIGPSASMDPKRMMMKQKKGQPELLSNDHECISSPPDCF